ncbi:MAG: DUF2191 domain-containing protein [Deltaproteobacteria bacterium]|nr:DUF2191 domain-containing protein [Deltaproteobacteria bacterium]MBW2138402.1 DUF2191 domain-containing protein [Deltaproteobacteria bacterium]
MGTHMKTTVDISTSLLQEAKKIAQKERSTLKALIEEGLQKVLKERRRKPRFRLRKATFKGKGLQPDVAGASWERIREMTYEGRGG